MLYKNSHSYVSGLLPYLIYFPGSIFGCQRNRIFTHYSLQFIGNSEAKFHTIALLYILTLIYGSTQKLPLNKTCVLNLGK